MVLIRLCTFTWTLFLSLTCYSQSPDIIINDLQQIPDNYFLKVDNKLSSIDKQLTKKSAKYLRKFKRHESRLQQRLHKIDSAPPVLFVSSAEKYNQLINDLKSKTEKSGKITGQYNAYLDSLKSSLSFLNQFEGLSNKVKRPINSLEQLQGKFAQSEKIKEYIAERKQQIKDLLSKYTKLPAGIRKEYEKLNKTAYYYSAQVRDYKEMLKDKKKIEQKAFSFLTKLPAFQKFMKENSQLASLFRVPDNYGTAQSLAGLQTRSSVQAIIQQQIASGGPNAQQIIQQNIAEARGELDKLKDKINKFGGGSSDIEMPDFKPNEQKTKNFLKRLEYSSDIQTQKGTKFFPVTSDIGLSLGYKLDNKSTIGIGAAYKLGWGSDFNNIKITHQGIGLRSFLNYKIKGSFHLSGGYEQNYRSEIKSIDQLKENSSWQTSGLIGVSKKYQVSKKIKGNMQLLWDFLSYQQIPRAQAVVFRIGYSLK